MPFMPFFRVGSTGGVQFQLDTPTEAHHAATYGSGGGGRVYNLFFQEIIDKFYQIKVS